MVALGLVGVGDGEVGDGLVEYVALAQVAADLGRLAGASVGTGQDMAAESAIVAHDGRREDLDYRLDLHVLELADIELPAHGPFGPAEEEVARRLHEALADHDPLAVVGIDALARNCGATPR